ncbi:alternative ribosome rescue factor ArfA [Marinobacterium jannaschii]|uniref:alternative ribosome rescue factor ArfA n=1 Tax=Marinobacterium jannaschii TaxID=64970 RepID=UPI000484DB5E|nr:alternative ribosome rescue factor ArfA [Marinobacterium jannaschii]
MGKQKKLRQSSSATDIGRGTINDNFLAALVTSKAYKQQVVKAKKGKGAYQRKEKHNGKGRESYLMAA